jgi:hypothetical protein
LLLLVVVQVKLPSNIKTVVVVVQVDICLVQQQ